ncbi:MAG: hypothetical protein CMJ20_01705 [Phycisphaeraceae bacterium]|nr:hypothetical protein [Phycisphaeraceae bacterium]|tara:strand:+ start:22301 stop:22717 length:417 start_codon:yes stop_codon:yes gene_type:complete
MKEQIIFVTNHTPIEITLLGRVIGARAVNQQVSVHNFQYFLNALEQAYPNGELSVRASLEEAQQSEDGTDDPASISTLGLTTSVEKALVTSGVTTLDQLTAMTAKDVVKVKGIAAAGVQEIEKQLAANNLTLKEANNE